ncbi:hypothetical protein JS533_010140 [Bifidobacterium amazonense]|uniref:Uncharacterized protein n=1 Tax=Bifidobacterium amazonense TaxID=2809027 RepID=A0ABS9VWZ5_9BIFI|nr:hypothetical protein [Bifidobacterium amazonense]MCH9276623.1 hypothetical protein [Bifidobacterium amazonense]
MRSIRRTLWWLGFICLSPMALSWVADRPLENLFSGVPLSCDLTKPHCDTMTGVMVMAASCLTGYAMWIVVGILALTQVERKTHVLFAIMQGLVTTATLLASLPPMFFATLTILIQFGG